MAETDSGKREDKTNAQTANSSERVYGVGRKLIGKNYATPDLYAKIRPPKIMPKAFSALLPRVLQFRCPASVA